MNEISEKDKLVIEYMEDRIKLYLVDIRHHKESIEELTKLINRIKESILKKQGK